MSGFSFLVLLGLSVPLGVAFPRGRILRGQENPPHQKPYMASLQINGKHNCGALLVAEQWVLSAAHCLEDAGNGTFQILLGAHSLSQPEPNKRLYGVRAFFPHPGSNRDTNDDDLLMIQLEERAVLNTDVQTAALQQVDQDVPERTQCEVAGWGITSNTEQRPDKLQYVALGIIRRSQCNRRNHHDGSITEKMMCADSEKKDSCKGDSGGPLVCNGLVEAVVTSGSRKCGNKKKPGIYTRVAPYADWIASVQASAN